MPKQQSAKKPKWDLSTLPPHIIPSTVKYLGSMEKQYRKLEAAAKLEHKLANDFIPRTSTFMDGKNKISKVINEEAQKALFTSELNEKLTLANKQLTEAKAEACLAWTTVEKLLNDYFEKQLEVLERWKHDATAATFADDQLAIQKQLAGIGAAMQQQSAMSIDNWKMRAAVKATTKATEIADATTRSQALIEESMRVKPIEDQLSDLRVALRHSLTLQGNNHPKPRQSCAPGRGNSTKRASSRKSSNSSKSNKRSHSSTPSQRKSKSPKPPSKKAQVKFRSATPHPKSGKRGKRSGKK